MREAIAKIIWDRHYLGVKEDGSYPKWEQVYSRDRMTLPVFMEHKGNVYNYTSKELYECIQYCLGTADEIIAQIICTGEAS